MLGTIALVLLLVLVTRSRLDINVIHDRNPVFVKLSDGSIRNGYEIKVLNMIAQPRRFNVAVEGLAGVTISFAGGQEIYQDSFDLDVEPDKLRAHKIFLTLPKDKVAAANTDFRFVVREIDGEENSSYNAKFKAPG